MFKQIETERLILRKLKLKDANDLFEYTSDPEVTKYVGWSRHEHIDETIRYLNKVIKQYKSDNPFVWAIELKENHKMIGTIEISTLNEKNKWCELDSDLNRQYWNRGINTEALQAVIRFIFTNLNLNKIQAICYAQNIGSYKVLQKAGMTFEGTQRQHLFKNGQFHDILRFSILKEEYE